jgi:pyridoxamine 5'-phosphate oxidase
MPDLYGERLDYTGDHLLESNAPSDPFALFDVWLADAFVARERGLLPEPTAMVVATCVDEQPSARTVLLKNVSNEGFTFFTNYNSRKGSELPEPSSRCSSAGIHRTVRCGRREAPNSCRGRSRRPTSLRGLVTRSLARGPLSSPRPLPHSMS